MRIGLFSWESLYSLAVGGLAVHVSELALALDRRGHEVHVFTRIGHNQPTYSNISGVHYHRCAFGLDPDFIKEMDRMCHSMTHRFFEVEDYAGRFDVVHAHDWMASNAVSWIKADRGHPVIMTLHSTDYGRNGNQLLGGTCEDVREREWNAGYIADRLITVSGKLKDEISRLYQVPEEKTRVIYNGVNPEVYEGQIDPGAIKACYGIGPLDPMVLFVGRMTVQKGPDILVRCIPEALQRFPTARFVFAGDGYMRDSVEQLAHSLGVHWATRFLGIRNGIELINLYKAADVIVVPSRNEPFGIVILEAWSAGKPVVATNTGGPAEFVWNQVTGLHVQENPESVAYGTGQLLADYEYGRWMGHNGRLAVDTAFTWDIIASQTEQVYLIN